MYWDATLPKWSLRNFGFSFWTRCHSPIPKQSSDVATWARWNTVQLIHVCCKMLAKESYSKPSPILPLKYGGWRKSCITERMVETPSWHKQDLNNLSTGWWDFATHTIGGVSTIKTRRGWKKYRAWKKINLNEVIDGLPPRIYPPLLAALSPGVPWGPLRSLTRVQACMAPRTPLAPENRRRLIHRWWEERTSNSGDTNCMGVRSII